MSVVCGAVLPNDSESCDPHECIIEFGAHAGEHQCWCGNKWELAASSNDGTLTAFKVTREIIVWRATGDHVGAMGEALALWSDQVPYGQELHNQLARHHDRVTIEVAEQ